MAKFLNKKEQVIDFKLTPYGTQRLSAGDLKPVYYAFFDDGVLYDSEYAGFSEDQNDIHIRIKEDTSFIEGIVRFEEIESSEPPPQYLEATIEDTLMQAQDIDISPAKGKIFPNKYSFDSAIGDARFEGENTQAAPAWKLVTCQGEIEKSTSRDTTHYNLTSGSYDTEATEFDVPQIDVVLRYTKLAGPASEMVDPERVDDLISQTGTFVDGNVIRLVKDDLVVYAEELNTQLLTENFDIEVFEVTETTTRWRSDGTPAEKVTTLEKKMFEQQSSQVIDGMMVAPNPYLKTHAVLDPSAVEYFFDILTDRQVSAKIGCQCAASFNRSSYYIDLDYDCDEQEEEVNFYDIYGAVSVPPICDVELPTLDEDCDD